MNGAGRDVEKLLPGGSNGSVVRIGDTVRRETRPWTPSIHALLRHLEAVGFMQAPRVVGVDSRGREALSFLPGECGNYPLPERLRTDAALRSAAHILRAYHDAAAGFQIPAGAKWQLPPLEPVEVVCHSDFAPYNCVFDGERVVGIIDFDAARPAPFAWDLAYAIYRFAPFAASTNPDTFGTSLEQVRRANLFFEAYGASVKLRADSIRSVVPRLYDLVDFIEGSATAGDVNFQRHIREGHVKLYHDDIAYIESEISPIFLYDIFT